MKGRLVGSIAVVIACSNGATPSDAGQDVTAQDVTQADATGNDATNDVEAGTPSVPQMLDQAGKLALWLEATSADVVAGDAGGIATWKDKSKNKNDAIAAAVEPVLDPGVVASHDAVHFGQVGAWLDIADATSLRFATDQVLVTAVTKVNVLRSAWFYKLPDGGLDGLEFFTANGGTADGGGPILSPYASLANGDNLQWGTPELNDAKFHIVTFRRTSSTMFEIAVDDIAPRTKTIAADDVSAIGTAAGIGSLSGPTPDYWIAEEIIVHDVSGIVSDADASSVHAYLKQKYGL